MEDHPRIRGAYSSSFTVSSVAKGSSPHTRGLPYVAGNHGREVGIIPAYAGPTLPVSGRRRPSWDHPRIRGAYCRIHREPMHLEGSSPHTRGLRCNSLIGLPCRRIIPAYAGPTARCQGIPDSGEDHPRIRGAYAGAHHGAQAQGGSSPHTRGLPASLLLDTFFPRISPAYAGPT